MKIALAALLALAPVPSLASPVPNHFQAGYSSSRTCFRTEYREEYIPGTADNPGYVKSWNDTLEVPCRNRHVSSEPRPYRRHVTVYEDVDTNDAKINDWHTRHEDQHLEIYCDNHPDADECKVYDD